jgi:hypothetical protein
MNVKNSGSFAMNGLFPSSFRAIMRKKPGADDHEHSDHTGRAGFVFAAVPDPQWRELPYLGLFQ